MNVPRRLFVGRDAELDTKAADEFGKVLTDRYPWLTKGSLEVLFRNARTEYLRVLDEESGGMATVRRLISKGDLQGAISRLRTYLEDDPEDPDAWMELGKLLCEIGEADEGYKAFAEARKHY
ncbi:hypothetical protein TALC_01015 [Thermoplasmatales archaeon BRNA1]|nr:hypothetical protein TALC_01015 [Thermoplasmatales archaeon BRNA1]